MAAFQRATDLGYRYLETDAHATADGVVVAFHDRTLDRVTDRTGTLSRLPTPRSPRPASPAPSPSPAWRTSSAPSPRSRFNIDLKDAHVIGPLAATLHRTSAWNRVCITSFSTRLLAQMRARLPVHRPRRLHGPRPARPDGAARPVLRRPRRQARPPRRHRRRLRPGPYGLGPVPFVTEAFIDHAHRLGLQVHAWTVNDPAAMARLLDLGIDGIITDDLQTLRRIMTARGLWHTPGPAARLPGDRA